MNMPDNLHIEVRVALLRNGKTLRSVSRDTEIPVQTISDVIMGKRGCKKRMPSVGAFRVLRALMPYLPADFADDLKREFPKNFTAAPAARKTAKRGRR